jgi:hypothetical protein
MDRADAFATDSQIGPEDRQFLAFVSEHFNAAYYTARYGDAGGAEIDPFEHWLTCGINEERQISHSVVLRYGKVATRSSSANWKHYRWRRQDIAARLNAPIPAGIISQIFNQARHDPAVLAPGANSVAQLTRVERESDGYIDVAGLQGAIQQRTEFLVIVPHLSIDPGQCCSKDLVAALTEADIGSVRTIVTDHDSSENSNNLSIPVPFKSTNVLYWQDFWIRGPEVVKMAKLAYLIGVLLPRVTIVANSRHGYEMISRFGLGLSQRTKIYSLFESTEQGVEFAARFARRTLPAGTALTDDAALAARLSEQFAEVLGNGIVALPDHPSAAFNAAVTELFMPI